MALIVCNYIDYFVYGRRSHCFFERGEVSYFDPIERTFLRITPSRGETPAAHWIPLPIIKEVEIYKNYLRYMGNTTFLEDYDNLDDLDFSCKIAELAEKYGFENCLYAYASCCYGEIILKWIADNNIPNCKLRRHASFMKATTREELKNLMAYNKEQLRLEELQEEEFKKSMCN